jgi:hypothetical protein
MEATSATTSLLLVRLAAASSLSSALSWLKLNEHANSGAAQSNSAFLRLLWLFIATNVLLASVQMCGGIAIVIIALAAKSHKIWWYQWIFLVRFLVLTNICSGACAAHMQEELKD